MNRAEYAKLLLDKRWKRKRNRILERDKYQCTVCESKSNLCVHHTYYIADHMPWEYPDSSLLTVCEDCHRDYHMHNEIEVRGKRGKKKCVVSQKSEKRKKKRERRANKHITSVVIQEKREPRFRKKVNGVWVEFTKPV